MSIRRVRTAILISGRGSNMVSLATAAQAPDFPAEIALVISNRPEAEGLSRAHDMDIPAIALDHTEYDTREDFDRIMQAHLLDHDIELVCCAGFMRILSPWFTEQWPSAMLNIHPSLLPKYKGLHTHRRALESGDPVHGCTVHFVNEELDGGASVLQSEIEILPDDTPESLAQRLLPVEHETYINALYKVASEMQER